MSDDHAHVLRRRSRFDQNEWWEATGAIGVGGLVAAWHCTFTTDPAYVDLTTSTVSQQFLRHQLHHLDPDMFRAETPAGQELLAAASAAKRLSVEDVPDLRVIR